MGKCSTSNYSIMMCRRVNDVIVQLVPLVLKNLKFEKNTKKLKHSKCQEQVETQEKATALFGVFQRCFRSICYNSIFFFLLGNDKYSVACRPGHRAEPEPNLTEPSRAECVSSRAELEPSLTEL